jgi:hypothetical protein
MRITNNGQEYEVDLSVTPAVVQAIKHRRPLPHGYSWGSDGTYLSKIKVDGANWKRIVKAAKAESEKVGVPV